MNLLQLESFVKVAETENISQAADLLNITQPALSHRIYLLEKEWGISLFDRVAKSVFLNENGRALLPYAKQILEDVNYLEKMVHLQTHAASENIVLNICAASNLVMEAISSFQKEYPNYTIIPYYHSDSKEISADLCVDSSVTLPDSPYDITLITEELLIAFPIGHPYYKKHGVALKSLSELPFLCGSKERAHTRDTTYFCKKAGFSPKIIYGLSNEEHRRRMVEIGRGISFFTTSTRLNPSESGIQLAKVIDVPCYRYINLHCCKQDQTSQQALKFYHYLERFIHDKVSSTSQLS